MTAQFLVGDALSTMRSMPAGSVDLVLTSSPFLGLRDYLSETDPAKAHEIGGEPTPGAFIDHLLDVAEECARVLAPHGSMVWELGDSFASPGGTTDNRPGSLGGNDFAPRSARAGSGPGWPLDKSLCMVPELFRVALAYGLNSLTGRSTPRWRVRNVIRWVRSNPPVGHLGDKFRCGTSDIVVACKSRTRYFDLDAVRTPSPRIDNHRGASTQYAAPGQPVRSTRAVNGDGPRLHANEAGAPPLDWWRVEHEPDDVVSMTWADYCALVGPDDAPDDVLCVPGKGYRGSHYATWPTALLVRPLLAMCPERVCRTCGAPATAALPDCGHDDWRPGMVLDPFAGTGTTLVVATGHCRDAIGIDLDARNVVLARERLGMFLDEGAA